MNAPNRMYNNGFRIRRMVPVGVAPKGSGAQRGAVTSGGVAAGSRG